MLSVNNITMRFGGRILFEDVTCSFMAGRRYAITGPNGAGKTTLMKILAGDFEPTKGSITRPKKLGILRQDQFAFDEFRVIDTVIMGNAPLWKALQERDVLYAKPHDKLTDKDGMRLGELEGIVGEEGGYTAEADAAILLDGLGIEAELHERKMSELQGGQKVRVLLTQALFGNPPALLLDESYNANGASMRAALDVLRLQPAARRVAILGDMLELGDAGPKEHASLAADAIRSADLVFTCGPLMGELFAAVPEPMRGAHTQDSASLAPIVARALAPGDAVLVKGSLGSRMKLVVNALEQRAEAA